MSVALTNPRPRRAIDAPVAASEISSDEILLARIANGDGAAMRTLYARYHVAVYRFVLRVIPDATMAEALVSDVFFDLWRQARHLQTHASAATATASTWLLAIASAKAQAIRTERASTIAAARDTHGRQSHRRLNGQIVPMRGRGETLRRALDDLPAEQREVIDLVYYHRRSVAEVGEIIGAPDAVVQARMEQARCRLAELARVG